jgi:hypothetical protein
MLAADADKKVKESKNRIHKFARHLLEKQTALVAFFSWGRGYQYYTAVIYPYERRQDGELWLLMGISEGILQLDYGMSLEEPTEKEVEPNVPLLTIARKPIVTISKQLLDAPLLMQPLTLYFNTDAIIIAGGNRR